MEGWGQMRLRRVLVKLPMLTNIPRTFQMGRNHPITESQRWVCEPTGTYQNEQCEDKASMEEVNDMNKGGCCV